MIDAISDAAMQHTIRANYNSENQEQAVIAKKNDRIREKRPVEKSEKSLKSQMNLRDEQDTKAKNIIEDDGEIIVEKYDKDGRLIRKIPPGYLPFGEMA
jgi:hypothetical protein